MISAEAQEVIDKHQQWKKLNAFRNRPRNPITVMWDKFTDVLVDNRYMNEWFDNNYNWVTEDSIAREGYIDPKTLSIDHPLVQAIAAEIRSEEPVA